MRYDTDVISKNIKRRQKIKKVIIILFYLILIPVILFSILLMFLELGNSKDLPGFFDYELYTVTSDSMEPKLKVNDMILVKKGFTNDQFKVGNIITFKRLDGEIITHRIDRIVLADMNNAYITKGDNNKQTDKGEVKYEQIIGKVVLTMPKLGSIISILKNKFVFLLCVIVLISIIFIDYYQRKKKMSRKLERKKFEKKSDFYF